jgi:nicotinate-nucleotide--dimethylbenzimidazole phosphoribosyltransferase
VSWPRPVPVVGDATSAAQRAAEPGAWAFPPHQRESFYDIVFSRRDIRRFRPVPVPRQVLARVLSAAHSAPSVGHSQPWRFVVVTDPATRETAALIALRERNLQARVLDPQAGRKMMDLQLDGIREAPVGIVVCCDRRAPAVGVLGRATFADADLWSCACAIENMWLSARAEGLGLGWVTLFPPAELAGLVRAPDGVETLGWLCLGWPDERPPQPGLARAGWSKKLALEDVVLDERWPTDHDVAPPASAVRSPGPDAVVGARDGSDQLLAPPGALGALDRYLDALASAGVTATSSAALVLAGADHPVCRHGVSAYAQSVTREVMEATVAGQSVGASLAGAAGMQVFAVDAGIDGEAVSGAVPWRPKEPRGDIYRSDALSPDDVTFLVEGGRCLGTDVVRVHHCKVAALGEVGIGNTTVAGALAGALLGLQAHQVAGLGAGADTAMIETKREIIAGALSRAGSRIGLSRDQPRPLLAALGGPEIAFLTGVTLGVAAAGGCVVLDGLATSIPALCAVRMEPGVTAYLVAGQVSREMAHRLVLDELGLEPLLDVRARAGEGAGAVLAWQLLHTALRARSTIATTAPLPDLSAIAQR